MCNDSKSSNTFVLLRACIAGNNFFASWWKIVSLELEVITHRFGLFCRSSTSQCKNFLRLMFWLRDRCVHMDKVL